MSIFIIKIKDEEKAVFEKIVKAFTKAKVSILKDEDDLDEELMARLMDEGIDSEIVSTELFKKELQRYAGKH